MNVSNIALLIVAVALLPAALAVLALVAMGLFYGTLFMVALPFVLLGLLLQATSPRLWVWLVERWEALQRCAARVAPGAFYAPPPRSHLRSLP